MFTNGLFDRCHQHRTKCDGDGDGDSDSDSDSDSGQRPTDAEIQFFREMADRV
jgi:hypothetical protein